MSEEFGGNFVSLTDEDGNEIELEHLDTIEYNGSVYISPWKRPTRRARLPRMRMRKPVSSS